MKDFTKKRRYWSTGLYDETNRYVYVAPLYIDITSVTDVTDLS